MPGKQLKIDVLADVDLMRGVELARAHGLHPDPAVGDDPRA
ncbi:hypothetical protein ACU4GR_04695 [Methylobacterium oryzae CBMB20]